MYARTLRVVSVGFEEWDFRGLLSYFIYFLFFSVFYKFYTIINELLKNIFQLPSSIYVVVAGFHDSHLWDTEPVSAVAPRLLAVFLIFGDPGLSMLTPCTGSCWSAWKLKTLVGIKGHCFIRIIHSNTINSPCLGGGGGFYSREKESSKHFSYLSFFLPITFLAWQLETKEGHRVGRHFLWYTWVRVKLLILSMESGLKQVRS